MLQNPCKTLGFKKNMVYKIPPGKEVNHIQPVAYQKLKCHLKAVMILGRFHLFSHKYFEHIFE